ncbi:hypothetical protein MUB24_03640 [Lederbergia sp. NSJ-179]|uniref:hypothetical protein n=1 Tax=Lederbergia sp. NSJ-179 TaxID=2931402 RepID=UPI001FD4C502|nr:hypothetical protein [Lederbergia sp. NSJ-179]MCJ7840016.1 hypothetical protein [Lederbergia sp. NSJ-179]
MRKLMLFMILFAFFNILFIQFSPAPVQACSCAELPGVEEEFDRSKAVFSGKVLEVREKTDSSGYMYKSILFQVIKTWKGIKESQVIITTGIGGGDCGIDFKEGQEYLVYADETDTYEAKTLSTVICDRTNKIHSSQEDLEILGEGQPPTAEIDLTNKGSNEIPSKDIDHTKKQDMVQEKGIPLAIWMMTPVGILFIVGLIAFLFQKREG